MYVKYLNGAIMLLVGWAIAIAFAFLAQWVNAVFDYRYVAFIIGAMGLVIAVGSAVCAAVFLGEQIEVEEKARDALLKQ